MSRNYFKPVRDTEVDTKIARERLEKDMDRFLREGGIIQVLDSGARSEPIIASQRQLTKRQVKTAIERKKRRATEEEE